MRTGDRYDSINRLEKIIYEMQFLGQERQKNIFKHLLELISVCFDIKGKPS